MSATSLIALALLAAAPERAALDDTCLSKNSGAACEQLGRAIAKGELRERFPDEAGFYFALACQDGAATACPDAQPLAKRYPDYEDLDVDVGCMLRDNGLACEEVANAIHEEGPPTDAAWATARTQRALELDKVACERKQAESCLGASRILVAGLGVKRDARAAHVFEARACDLNLALACQKQAERSHGAEAVRLYEKACVLAPPSPHACLGLARSLESAKRPRTDVVAAYQHACSLLSFDACQWLATDSQDPDQSAARGGHRLRPLVQVRIEARVRVGKLRVDHSLACLLRDISLSFC